MLEATSNYKTRRELEIETEELYDLGYRAVNYASGKYTIFNFDITFINPNYTEDGMLDESFKFLNELIFHPNITELEFNPTNYKMGYNIMRDNLTTLKENNDLYSQIRTLEELTDDIPSYRSSGYLEDLDKIDAKKLYDYYKDMIDNDSVDIFIIGNIGQDIIEQMVNKYLPFKTNNKNNEYHMFTYNEVNDEIKFVNEHSDKEQSNLVLGFKLDDMSKFDQRYVLYIYNYILGGSGDSNLFKTIREKYSLCYYINSMMMGITSTGFIRAGINARDYEEALSLINTELNKMKTGDFDESKISNGIKQYINSLKEIEDNPDNIISMYANKEYLDSDSIEDRISNINKVTKEDIIRVAQFIHLNVIYLLEGRDVFEEE
jgi:predicted Zn-dependent peptidase